MRGLRAATIASKPGTARPTTLRHSAELDDAGVACCDGAASPHRPLHFAQHPLIRPFGAPSPPLRGGEGSKGGAHGPNKLKGPGPTAYCLHGSDEFGLQIGLEALGAAFIAIAALLDAAERRLGARD